MKNVKNEMHKTKEDIVTWDTIEKAIEEYCQSYANDFYANWNCRNWVKDNYNRTYITVRVYKNRNLRKEIDCGYWDNNESKYVPYNKYHKVLNLLTLEME